MTFKAQYFSRCDACRNPIRPGEDIDYADPEHPHDGRYVHDECRPEPGYDDAAFLDRLNRESEAA